MSRTERGPPTGPGSRLVVLLLVGLLAAPAGLLPPAGAEGCDKERHDDLGWVCLLPNGLYEVFSPDGESLGTTHGPDPVDVFHHIPASDGGDAEVAAVADLEPACVSGAAGTRHIQVIYARANDDADRYTTLAPVIRDLIADAHGTFTEALSATGGAGTKLRVKCVSGAIHVPNAVLPTPRATASFSTLKSDLKAMGYDDPKAKYLVFYDDPDACACGGLGEIYGDDTASSSNLNNGNAAEPQFGVNYGYTGTFGTKVFLHELSHTLGAVQLSAPHTSGAWHCTDGRDTMCYDDGGSQSGNYNEAACSTEVYDCGRDDYCNASPAPGSYLAGHWNVCSSANGYLIVPDLAIDLLSCDTDVRPGDTVACQLRASGSATSIYFDLSWGDGGKSRVPATGTVAPGTSVTATHVYDRGASFPVVATAKEPGGAESPQASTTVRVLEAPTIDTFWCPTKPLAGATVKCDLRGLDGDSTGLAFTLDWGDGTSSRVPATGFVSPGTLLRPSHVYEAVGLVTAQVSVVDDSGLSGAPRSTNIDVQPPDTTPEISAFSCTAAVTIGGTTPCSVRGSDKDGDDLAFAVSWGDGTSERVPSSGWVSSGSRVDLAHTYDAPGEFTVSVTVSDPTGRSGATWSLPVTVEPDKKGPTVRWIQPLEGRSYQGCGAGDLYVPAPLATGKPPILVGDGCIVVEVADAHSAVEHVELWAGADLLASLAAPNAGGDATRGFYHAPVEPATPGPLDLVVRALDTAGNAVSATRTVYVV